ncbi:spore protease YyaC [Bacillus testis]|uniref:spore protease YyaC n=1 Tax=Bacillus testis TaxID=1622072 RepID=UPI00067EFDA6|nr:spore protease YyaC [Bacillus testis]
MYPKKRGILPDGQPSPIPYAQDDAPLQLADKLLSYMPAEQPSPIVIACIGTDRSTGDSLGPLVGSFLKEAIAPPYHVYGTLDEPIHAVNLQEQAERIQSLHELPFIIAVDACLGRIKNVGTLQVHKGPLKPGAGVHKNLPEIGHIHVTGIVNVSGFMEFAVLQNTRLSLVIKMARTIADGIIAASRKTGCIGRNPRGYWPMTEQTKEKLDYN